MFIGRENELKALNKAWQSDKFQFIVVYGRRRVGKSMLLTHFSKGKQGIYHLAQETSHRAALEQFSRSVAAYTQQEGLHYKDWEEALGHIASLAQTQRLMLIIDEFPYIAESSPGLLSLLQNIIDTKLLNTSLMLVLCGSTVGFMEREVLGVKSPLFGRRTGQMRIEPFDYLTAAQFVPKYSNIDKALTYSIFGGIPHYLTKLDDNCSLADNIKENVLTPYSYLYDEPILLLKQELREPALYNAIIEAIASGSSRLNEIATNVGEDVSKCGKYLRILVELGFILRETPVESKPSGKKTLYSIADPFFAFWYKFVFSNRTNLVQGLLDYVLEEEILASLSHYTGRLFERICIEYMHILNREKKLPFVYRQIGRWWGQDNRSKTQVELDIVALGKNEVLIGECKWTNEPVDIKVLNKLIDNSEAFPCEKKIYVLFSKSGFTQAVIDEAKSKGVLLYSLDDIFTCL